MIDAAIIEVGFIRSTFDKCLYYKITNGALELIGLYVDDLLLVIRGRETLQMLQDKMNQKFGEVEIIESGISFLGTTLAQSTDHSELEINAVGAINQLVADAIVDLKLVGKLEAKTPADSNFFDFESESEALQGNKKSLYITYLYKLAYLAMVCRFDFVKEIRFLQTRVSICNINDLAKLIRIIKYLHSTANLPLKFVATNLKFVAYVDSSFLIHSDRKSHTGAALCIGQNPPILILSNKQTINTRSSTEAELVALDDTLTYILWLKKLLCEIKWIMDNPTIVYQDNTSTMKMANSGEGSFKKSKHIENKYYTITNYINDGIIKLEHISTDEMLADFFTKPLQSQKFLYFRRKIMGELL